ncbi:NADP-dependent oxidoreductase domain-containing protein [Hypoxylon rubiginosum]|uniref:NADP-dependent oxidoreductase domain-containing protein n=1 Tax=Hypoxylon rubiginosum TaxID=110542 RepID=A0ACC0D8W2_9PEZI|nr:NADP-dependent oxidoreductase domain-containing protein [Hypoxylon rubiginosum]
MERIQTGLASGMAAAAGFPKSKPKRPDPQQDGKNTIPLSICPDARSRIKIATSKAPEIEASHLCIGTWSWGDRGTWHWKDDELPAVREAFQVLFDAGINFIDTAQVYGGGKSEEIVGELIADLPRDSVVVQTKWHVSPLSSNNLLHPVDAPVRALKDSLKRLKLDYVDVYLVHGPIHPQGIASVAEGMAECVRQGLTRAVGVANYDLDDFMEMRKELARHDIPLAVNQCEYNVLRRYPEMSGQMAAYREMDVVFQSYSSLAQGRLTGKYGVQNPAPATRRFSNYDAADVQPALDVLGAVAMAKGKSVAAVALNYNISKGALPVVGIRSAEQARQALGALGWRLAGRDVETIDRRSFEGGKSMFWQQG